MQPMTARKKKRNRINKERVDITAAGSTNNNNSNNNQRRDNNNSVKVEITDRIITRVEAENLIRTALRNRLSKRKSAMKM